MFNKHLLRHGDLAAVVVLYQLVGVVPITGLAFVFRRRRVGRLHLFAETVQPVIVIIELAQILGRLARELADVHLISPEYLRRFRSINAPPLVGKCCPFRTVDVLLDPRARLRHHFGGYLVCHLRIDATAAFPSVWWVYLAPYGVVNG